MFDTYVVGQRPQNHYHETSVLEFRAPTDQSVALLKEMEAAAQSKVVEVIKNKDNTFHYSAHVFYNPQDPFTKMVAVRFSLNGEDHRFTIQVPYTVQDKHELALLIKDKIMETLAVRITITAFSSKDL